MLKRLKKLTRHGTRRPDKPGRLQPGADGLVSCPADARCAGAGLGKSRHQRRRSSPVDCSSCSASRRCFSWDWRDVRHDHGGRLRRRGGLRCPRMLMGIAFSLGLLLVVLPGATVFSDCLMVMGWAGGRLGFGRVMRLVDGLAPAIWWAASPCAAPLSCRELHVGRGEVAPRRSISRPTRPACRWARPSSWASHVTFLSASPPTFRRTDADRQGTGHHLPDQRLHRRRIPNTASPTCSSSPTVFHQVRRKGLLGDRAGQRVAALDIPLDQFGINLAFVPWATGWVVVLLVGAFYWFIYRRPRQRRAQAINGIARGRPSSRCVVPTSHDLNMVARQENAQEDASRPLC